MAVGSRQLVIAGMVGSAVLAALKLMASAATGSAAMAGTAIQSGVDAGARAGLLVGLGRADRPADVHYPYGHGRELHFWAFVVAILLFAFGAGIALHRGIVQIRDPRPLVDAVLAYWVLGLALVFEAAGLVLAWRAVDREPDAVPLWRAMRAETDPVFRTALFGRGAGLIGLVIALVGVLLADRFGMAGADGAASVAIGVVLAGTAVMLAVETRALLVGEASSDELLEDIIGLAGQASFVDGVNEARTMHFGPADVLVNLSVDARDSLNAGVVETGISELEAEIIRRHPEVTRVFIEIQKARDHDSLPLPGAAPGVD